MAKPRPQAHDFLRSSHPEPRTQRGWLTLSGQVRRDLVLALLVDLALLRIGGVRVVPITAHLSISLRVHHGALGLAVLSLRVSVRRLIADGWQRWSAAILLIPRSWNLVRVSRLAFDLAGLRCPLPLVLGFSGIFFFLLASLPLLSNLLEFCVWC